MDEQIRARVERGAALLDEKRPGWWQKIHTSYLNVSRCDLCVLGQLECAEARMDFMNAWDALAPGLDCAAYGFDVYPGERAFTALTAEWKRLIRIRREQAVSDA